MLLKSEFIIIRQKECINFDILRWLKNQQPLGLKMTIAKDGCDIFELFAINGYCERVGKDCIFVA